MNVILKTEKTKKEWTNYSDHMNEVYYIYTFDIVADFMPGKFKMDGESVKNGKKKHIGL